MSAVTEAAVPPGTWPPGPPPLGRHGHLEEFVDDRIGFLRRCATYGDFVPFRVGDKAAVYLGAPEYVEAVTNRRSADFSKDYLAEVFHPILRRQLLLSNTNDWLEERRLVQPFLHPGRMDGYAEQMRAIAERTSRTWHPGETFDLAESMRRLTLEVLAQTVFDVDVVTQAAEVGDIVDRILADVNRRIGQRSRIPVPLPTPQNLRLASSLRRLDILLDRLIDARRRTGARGDDLLSALVASKDAAGRPLSNQGVKLTALPLFFAGHETTAMTLTWTLYLLARHADVRERVLAELDQVLGDRPATNADVRALPFLGDVVHESLRLYPPGWGFGRLAVRDTEIGPYRIPPGVTVFMAPWLLHRDTRWFDRPAEFLPERWADGLAARLPRCAYVPFSSGPRRCPGNTFATVESIVVLATLLRRARLVYAGAGEPVLEPSVTLRPKDGLLMKVAA